MKEKITAKVIDMLREGFFGPMTPAPALDASFTEIGLDEVAMGGFGYELEEEFEVEVPLDEMSTLQEVIDFLVDAGVEAEG